MDDRMDDPHESLTETESLENETETLSAFFGTPQEVLNRYTHCILCGSNLHFSHQTDFSRNLTQETAKCPECGIRVRSVLHRLQ